MMMVKVRLGMSPIEGLGHFALEDIAYGTVTWSYVNEFDRTFIPQQIVEGSARRRA